MDIDTDRTESDLDDDMTSQDLFKSQELPELAATVELTKEVQTQPNCLPQTMPESPMIQSFVIKPANPKRCIQSLEPIQSPKSTKNLPSPKLRIRQSQEGFISDLTEPTKSQNDVTIVNDVIDLCEDDEPEVIAIQDPQSTKKSSNTTSLGFELSADPSVVPEATGRPRRHRQPPKRFQDFRTGNTPKTKIFKTPSQQQIPTFDKNYKIMNIQIPRLKKHFGIEARTKSNKRSLFVTSVQSDGDAFGYLHENDIIYSINGKTVTSAMQFVNAMKNTSTPRVYLVIARLLTTNATNDVTHNVTNSGKPSKMSTVDSQVDKLQQMSIRSNPRNSLDKPFLNLIEDTPTQIFKPTQTTQITDTQNIIEHENETELQLTLEASQELFPVPKSPISTAQLIESAPKVGNPQIESRPLPQVQAIVDQTVKDCHLSSDGRQFSSPGSMTQPTQIGPEPTQSCPRTFQDKETQAESIQYYDVENAKETPETVTELAFHGLSEAVGFLGADLESRLSLEAKTLYYKRLFDW